MTKRSVTIIMEGETELVRIYKESHGDPEFLGRDLAVFCDIEMVRTFEPGNIEQAHGIRCLAAQIILQLKFGVGDVYIGPPHGPIPEWIDFTYIVRGQPSSEEQVAATILCTTQTGEYPFSPFDVGKCIYAGTAKRWLEWLDTVEDFNTAYEQEMRNVMA